MIKVVNLTKRYAGHTALSEHFVYGRPWRNCGSVGSERRGQEHDYADLVLYLPATSGTVRVAGLDVFHQCDEVRRRIGYMPENNPLHPEMRVREYLKFRARLKGAQ